MICRLCLLNSNNCFHLFEAEGIRLKAVPVIIKHFGFEPKEKDVEPLQICRSCWSITDNFHNLYNLVDKTQKELKTSEWNADLEFSDKTVNEFVNTVGLKSETESINSDNEGDNDFLSTSEFLHESLADSYQNPVKCEILEENELTESDLKIEAKTENNIEELKKCLVNRSKINFERSKNDLTKLNKEKNSRNAESIKQKKRGRPSAAELKDKKLKFVDSESKKERRPANEVVSDEEINKMKKIMCQICMIEIPTFLKLKKHFIKIHDEEGYAICCDKKFYKRFKFVNHLKMHVNPNEFKCPHCDRQFSNKRYITQHIENMHTKIEKVRNFSCETCSKSFVQKEALARHKLTHIPESERIYHCDQCPKSFPTQGLLSTHKKTVHEGRYRGICALCGKTYQNPQDLKRHSLEHEGIREPKAQCNVCGNWLANKYKLKRHKKTYHENQNTAQKCPTCEKTFPNPDALKSHIRYTHNAQPKFQCNICEKYFKRQLVLKEHMAVHSGQPLYACPHCPKTFTHSSNMHHHRKRVHPKEFEETRQLQKIKKIPVNS